MLTTEPHDHASPSKVESAPLQPEVTGIISNRDGVGRSRSPKSMRSCAVEHAVQIVRTGSLSELKSWRDRGGDLNVRWVHNQGLLFMAAQRAMDRKENLEICEFLVKEVGLLVNEADKQLNQTALFFAAAKGLASTAACLLEHRATVDHVDSNGQTPLFYAARNGRLACVQVLLEHGANQLFKDVNSQVPVCYAATYGHAECVEALLKSAGPKAAAVANSTDRHSRTPLWAALDVSSCQFLLSYACNPDHPDVHQQSVIFDASSRCQSDKIGILLRFRADANLQDRHEQTPLFYAVQAGSLPICKQLVEGTAKCDLRDKYGLSPLLLSQRSQKQLISEFFQFHLLQTHSLATLQQRNPGVHWHSSVTKLPAAQPRPNAKKRKTGASLGASTVIPSASSSGDLHREDVSTGSISTSSVGINHCHKKSLDGKPVAVDVSVGVPSKAETKQEHAHPLTVPSAKATSRPASEKAPSSRIASVDQAASSSRSVSVDKAPVLPGMDFTSATSPRTSPQTSLVTETPPSKGASFLLRPQKLPPRQRRQTNATGRKGFGNEQTIRLPAPAGEVAETRQRHVFALKDPHDSSRTIPFETPEYEAALNNLCRELPWFPSGNWEDKSS